MAHDIEWCYQGEDNWQAVPAEYVLEENAASGMIRIASAFIDQIGNAEPKRNVCFKVKAVRMVDNRGQLPASLLDKVEAAIDGLQWVKTTMGPGFGEYSISMAILQNWETNHLTHNGTTCVGNEYDGPVIEADPISSASNRLWIQVGVEAPEALTSARAYVELKASSTSFGMPHVLGNLPDGTEILEAWAELRGNTLTSNKTTGSYGYTDCDTNTTVGGDGPDTDPDVEAVQPSILAFKSATEFDVLPLGVPAWASTQQKVVNIKPLIDLMYSSRNAGTYIGYGFFFSPLGLTPSASGLASVYEKPPIRMDPVCGGDLCYSPGTLKPYFYTDLLHVISWTYPSWGNVWLKVDYHGKDKIGHLQPRYPAMSEL